MIPRELAPYAAVGAVLVGVWLHGHSAGADRADARHARAMAAAKAEYQAIAEDARRAEAARLLLERERDALRQELEELAASDPDADRRALGAASVLRLNRIGAP